MALKPSPEDLARALEDAGGLKLVRSKWSGFKNQVVLTFNWQGQTLQTLVAIVEVWDGEVPRHAKRRTTDISNGGVIMHKLKKKAHWTEDELRAEGMPLYLSDEWLLAALDRLGSQGAIEEEYGYSNQVLSRHFIRLGIETRPRLSKEAKDEARRLLKEGELSYAAIAEKTGISKPTVTRLAKET